MNTVARPRVPNGRASHSRVCMTGASTSVTSTRLRRSGLNRSAYVVPGRSSGPLMSAHGSRAREPLRDARPVELRRPHLLRRSVDQRCNPDVRHLPRGGTRGTTAESRGVFASSHSRITSSRRDSGSETISMRSSSSASSGSSERSVARYAWSRSSVKPGLDVERVQVLPRRGRLADLLAQLALARSPAARLPLSLPAGSSSRDCSPTTSRGWRTSQIRSPSSGSITDAPGWIDDLALRPPRRRRGGSAPP